MKQYKGKNAKYGTVDGYAIEALMRASAREEPDERNLAELCIESGNPGTINCSSAIDLMPSLIKRLK